MASPDPLQSAAQSFGVEPMQPDGEYGPTPPKLSNSTRRYTDLGQRGVSTYSAIAQLDRETAEEIDREEDRKWMAEMTRMEKANEWDQKVAIQEHSISALTTLKDLRGDESDYIERRNAVLSEFPLANRDPVIGAVLERQERLYETRRKALEDARKAEQDRLTKAAEDQDKTKSDIAEKYGVDGLTAYEKTINETGSPYEAIAAAVRAGKTNENKTALAKAGADTVVYDPKVGAVADSPDTIASDDVETAKRVREAEETRVTPQQLNAAKASKASLERRISDLDKVIAAGAGIAPTAEQKQAATEAKTTVEQLQTELAVVNDVVDRAAKVEKPKDGGTWQPRPVIQATVDDLFK